MTPTEILQGRLTVTVPEAAELLGISKAHAYELVRSGDLPSIHLGRRVLVPANALERVVTEVEIRLEQ